MKIFSKDWNLKLPMAKVVFVFLLLGSIVTAALYFTLDESDKLAPILSGMVVGLFLVLLQFVFSWGDHIEREKFQLLGLKNVLKTKKNLKYYGALIGKSKTRIDLMGRTCRHFLNDFSNASGGHPEAKLLNQALDRGVKVRILLPHPSQFGEKYRPAAEESKLRLESLSADFENFEVRYVDRRENHSLFVADDDVIIGPFFPDLESMSTPALHLDRNANLPGKYLDYFQEEWDKCGQN